jgi:hypothetical protein
MATVKKARLSRQSNGAILLELGQASYEFSEDDCIALAGGLQSVALNNPPDVIVHFEDGRRGAFVERC